MTDEGDVTTVSAAEIVGNAHRKVDEALQRVAQLAGTEQLDGYLRRVGDGYGGSHRDLLETYDVALAELSSHLLGMEVAVCPSVIKNCVGGRQLVRNHLRYARRLEATARSIDQLLWGDVQAPSHRLDLLHRGLLASMAAHRDAEAEMLESLEATLTPADRDALAVRLERATRRAPRRPHPHAPRLAGWSRLIYRPVAAWDRFLNVLDSRDRPMPTGPPRREPGLWASYLLGRPLPAQRTSDTASPPSATGPTSRK